MHQIDSTTAVTSMPTPNAAGTPGFFAHGDGIGVPYTVVTSDWANAVQMELANVITSAGLTLSKTSQTQLLAALTKIHGVQQFRTSATFTVPAYVYQVKVTVIGGGSGATGCAPLGVLGMAGASGGGGGWAIKYCTVTPGQSIAVTVGTGGVGAAASVGSGVGGTSSFGSFCSATGGGAAAVGGWAGAAPGIGTGGDINGQGGWGSDGSPQGATNMFWAGLSGGSLFSGSVRSGTNPTGTGANAVSPGAGGGASYLSPGAYDSLAGPGPGGSGASGIVVVEW